MRLNFVIALMVGLSGCGPLFAPMQPRLSAEDQRKVDQMWDNMLTPVGHVDREALLDANVAYWMFTIGVDRMHLTSEKYFTGGTAVMEMDCDRANPDADEFTITVLDLRGRTVRRERYTRAEVEESSRVLRGIPDIQQLNGAKGSVTIEIGGPTTRPVVQSATAPVETPEMRQLRLESERRRAAAAAATQPAAGK
jgi:hypothetical protein